LNYAWRKNKIAAVMKKVFILSIATFFAILSIGQNRPAANKQKVAITPPMGWNSYNCFGAAVTEKEVRANALYMSKYLKLFGWNYIVIDYC
jgi:alpha-galactosidase